jgi:hypothetical protein
LVSWQGENLTKESSAAKIASASNARVRIAITV